MGLVLTQRQLAAMQSPRPRALPGQGALPSVHRAASLEHGVVLGIDPGTRVVGYGAVLVEPFGPRYLEAGVVQADLKAPIHERLAQIARELDLLMARLTPCMVVVEQAFAATNVQSALRIGEGRGVVLACAARTGCQIQQFPPAVAKRAVAGNGAAHKTQVAGMVRRLLGLGAIELELDATDALALALTAILRSNIPVRAGPPSKASKPLTAQRRARS